MKQGASAGLGCEVQQGLLADCPHRDAGLATFSSGQLCQGAPAASTGGHERRHHTGQRVYLLVRMTSSSSPVCCKCVVLT